MSRHCWNMGKFETLELQLISWGDNQSQKNPISASVFRKVFAKPKSFCNKLIIGLRISGYFGKCTDTMQNIQIICKVSG